MIYLSTSLILILCFAILGLIISYNKNKEDFQNKIELLERIIEELNDNLENNNQKIRLSNELKIKLRENNLKLSTYISDLNFELFETLYSKK